MKPVRTPKSIKGAIALCERYSLLAGEVGGIEAVRNAAIASANKAADDQVAPLLKEMAAIEEKMPAWWAGAAAELTQGKRKSTQLGGCMIGTKATSASLTLEGKTDKEAVAALQKNEDLAEGLLRTTVNLDRAAILKSLDGIYAKELGKIGFGKSEPVDVFFIKAVEQDGSIAGAGK